MTKPEMQPISVVVAGVAGMQEWKTADFAITVYFLSVDSPDRNIRFPAALYYQGLYHVGLEGLNI